MLFFSSTNMCKSWSQMKYGIIGKFLSISYAILFIFSRTYFCIKQCVLGLYHQKNMVSIFPISKIPFSDFIYCFSYHLIFLLSFATKCLYSGILGHTFAKNIKNLDYVSENNNQEDVIGSTSQTLCVRMLIEF